MTSPPSTSTAPASSWKGNLLLLLGGCLAALLLLEAFLRVYNPLGVRIRGDRIVLPRNFRETMTNNTNTKLEPVIVFSKNALGFRGPEPPRDFDGHLTVLAVGGSTTECLYLTDGASWPERLGARAFALLPAALGQQRGPRRALDVRPPPAARPDRPAAAAEGPGVPDRAQRREPRAADGPRGRHRARSPAPPPGAPQRDRGQRAGHAPPPRGPRDEPRPPRGGPRPHAADGGGPAARAGARRAAPREEPARLPQPGARAGARRARARHRAGAPHPARPLRRGEATT